jgi:CMP/dCMP kinase
MIITISGTPGAGKSIIGKILAKKLGYRFYSAGDVRGEYALDHGMTINELNKKAETDPASDKLVDNYMKELAQKEDDLVIDGRVGFLFFPDSIKVFVDADPEIRYDRVFKEARDDETFRNIKDAKKAMDKRVESDIKRYENLYHVNPYDLSRYDLVIDTTSISVEEAVGKIYRFAMFKSNPIKKQ